MEFTDSTAYLRMEYRKAKLRLRFAMQNIGFPSKDLVLSGNLEI